jgi:hypothetical protein
MPAPQNTYLASGTVLPVSRFQSFRLSRKDAVRPVSASYRPHQTPTTLLHARWNTCS